MSGRRQASHRGSFLIVCMGLVAIMTVVAFAFVISMRVSGEVGPAALPGRLARLAAQQGFAHASELLVADYLTRPLAPTSDVSPHVVLFAPIDNAVVAPRDPATSDSRHQVWNENDVLPSSKLLNPFRPQDNVGRVYAQDNAWLDAVTANSCPRYIEPSAWSTDLALESALATRTDAMASLPVVPATPTAAGAYRVDRPLWFDQGWKRIPSDPADPAYAPGKVRYRLRYAVSCEDLSGHLLNGVQRPFTTRFGGPGLADGDAAFAGHRGERDEFDLETANRYGPAAASMFVAVGSEIPFAFSCIWQGTPVWHFYNTGFEQANNGTRIIRGWDDHATPVLLGRSPWAWRQTREEVGLDTAGLPNLNAGAYDESYATAPGKQYSFPGMARVINQSQSGTSDQNGAATAGYHWQLQGAPTPYGSPTFPRLATARHNDGLIPDPEAPLAGDLTRYAYNEGPVDCPWRVNPLTAPAAVLRGMISAFRSPLVWEHALNAEVTGAGVVAPVTGLTSKLSIPNPFRWGFQSWPRGASSAQAASLHPFGQFRAASASATPADAAADPRSDTNPWYPSPVASFWRDDLGRWSDLYANMSGQGRFFRGMRAMSDFNGSAPFADALSVGPCVPRPDVAPRPTVTLPPIGLVPAPNGDGGNDGTSPFVAGGQRYVSRNGPPIGLYPADPAAYTFDARPDTPWMDALTAVASSVGVAIAAYQQGVPYPPALAETNLLGHAAYPAWTSTTRVDSDGDGFADVAPAYRNVGDLDRLFLLIMGEDPDHPGNNQGTRQAMYTAQVPPGQSGNTTGWYAPRICNLKPFDAASPAWSGTIGAQDPYDATNAKLINLRRASLLGIRKGLYDAVADYQTEAAALVPGGDADAIEQKRLQLKRCRLRDAERMINDMRMSFFGANLRYLDRTRTGTASRGRFRPLDLDGDGWAICSAYVPGAIQDDPRNQALPMVQNPRNQSQAMRCRFSQPADAASVVFDERPDNPARLDPMSTVADVPGARWVCFRDIDPAKVPLVDDALYTDPLTFTTADVASAALYGRSLAGYTRWFYPASPVASGVDSDTGPDGDGSTSFDGTALFPPDTYFSLSGYFVIEKSHFYRIIVRGEVWDQWKRSVVDAASLESVFLLDPDGDVYTRAANHAALVRSLGSLPQALADGTGMEDSCVVYQRWLLDRFQGGQERAESSR